MTGSALTLGQAIDQMLNALIPLDEAARRTALTAVCMQLSISDSALIPISPSSQAEASTSAAYISPSVSSSSNPPRHKVDIRALKEEKRPNSARQMACIVAFYLQELAPEGERKDSVNSQDLERFFKQAGYKLPTKMAQVLIDVKGAGHMDSAGRGEYKLNAVGYNLVAHKLPSSAE